MLKRINSIPLFLILVLLPSAVYAHGEQVVYIMFAHALMLIGWVFILIFWKSPFFDKLISTIALIVIFGIPYFISIPGWYQALLNHEILVPFAFAAVPMALSFMVLLSLRVIRKRRIN